MDYKYLRVPLLAAMLLVSSTSFALAQVTPTEDAATPAEVGEVDDDGMDWGWIGLLGLLGLAGLLRRRDTHHTVGTTTTR